VSLEALNAIAQLTAAVGVIASLFYLAAQIRQNTRSMRAVVVDALAHAMVDLLANQEPELTRAFANAVEDWDGSSDEERWRALPLLFAQFKLFENAWFQREQETLDAAQWDGWDAYMRIYFHSPGTQVWWSMRKAAFARGFRDYIESTEPVPDMKPLRDVARGVAATK
jgi:hypothetical protein